LQSVLTVATVTTVRTSAIAPGSRAMRKLENACAELDELETTAVSVSISPFPFVHLLFFALCTDSYHITVVELWA